MLGLRKIYVACSCPLAKSANYLNIYTFGKDSIVPLPKNSFCLNRWGFNVRIINTPKTFGGRGHLPSLSPPPARTPMEFMSGKNKTCR